MCVCVCVCVLCVCVCVKGIARTRVQVGGGFVERQDAAVEAEGLRERQADDKAGQHLLARAAAAAHLQLGAPTARAHARAWKREIEGEREQERKRDSATVFACHSLSILPPPLLRSLPPLGLSLPSFPPPFSPPPTPHLYMTTL